MEELLQGELGLGKRTKALITAMLSIFLICSLVFSLFLYSSTRSMVREQAIRSLTNLCQLNEDALYRACQNRSLMLEALAHRMSKREIFDTESVLDILRDFDETYDCYQLAVMDKDFNLYRTNGNHAYVAGMPLNREIWDTKPYISASYYPSDNQEFMVNLFSQPVMKDGEIQCVLVATYLSKDLAARMNMSSLQGKCYTFLINQNSEIVIHPHHYDDPEYTALMEYINKANIIPEDSGDEYFTYKDEPYYARYEKLPINDWYLMTCAREADVFGESRAITRSAFFVLAIMWLFVAVCTIWVDMAMYRFEDRLHQSYFYDETLGVGNGNALKVCFRKLPAETLAQTYLSVFHVDRLREYNYIHGYAGGDRLVRYVVQVFQEELPKVLLFRYKSDHFVVLDSCGSMEAVEDNLKKIQERFSRDQERGLISPFTISVGVRRVEQGVALRQLINDAMTAKETITGDHQRSYVEYSEAMRTRQVEYLAMESELPKALRNGEFHVYYQPKYHIGTGELIGAEALARWIKPDGTMVSPGAFIPCFEASNQIAELDEAVLAEVCQHMRRMQSAGLDIKPVSVNLSRVHLQQPGMIARIAEIIQASDIDPHKLSFEITESALLEERIPLRTIVDQIRDLGCQVDMDDYGIGASGPKALASNCFDVVKLDKSFVDDIGNSQVEAVIEATILVAKRLGLQVLAEGVEGPSQVQRLMELGCYHAQGFFYSRPLPVSEYRALLKSGRTLKLELPEAAPKSYHNCFSEDFCTALDSTQIPIYIIDASTFEIIYANDSLRQYTKEDPLGKQCYKVLRGYDTPCSHCVVRKLIREGVSEAEEHRQADGTWSLVKASHLRWRGRVYYKIASFDITQQKQLEAKLRLHNQEYDAVARHSTLGILRYDIATDTASVNVDANLNRVEEYTIENYLQVVRLSNLVAPCSVAAAKAMFTDIRHGVSTPGCDLLMNLPDGREMWCHLDCTLIEDENGRPFRAIISFYDNTEQREKELEYQRWNNRLNTVMGEYAAYMEINLSTDTIEAEGRHGTWVENSKGRRYSASMNRMAAISIDREDRESFRTFFHRERLMGQFLAGNRECSVEYRAMLEDAMMQWYRTEVQMVSDPETGEIKASVLVSNVDVDLRERERLTYQAERDTMTGLYNRSTTETLIRKVLEGDTGERVCFLMVDLDDLRDINSDLGHPEGDRALKAIADCMTTQFRKTDIKGRIGGDEFVVLLRDVPEGNKLQKWLSGFMHRLSSARIGPNNDRPVRASIGGAMGTAGVEDFDTLYRRADLALYYTKATGKNLFNLYEPELESRPFTYQPTESTEA